MNIAFRCDATQSMGNGHMARCANLARAFKQRGHDCRFIVSEASLLSFEKLKQEFQIYNFQNNFTQDLEIDFISRVRQESFIFDWLVLDHYDYGSEYESKLKKLGSKIFVIDDLANRKHICDVLLDQNFYFDKEVRYRGLVDKDTRLLLGPEYALLKPEFFNLRLPSRDFDKARLNLMISFGGTDVTCETVKILKELNSNELDLNVSVVVGAQTPSLTEIQEILKNTDKEWKLYVQTELMHKLISENDIAIGAGGVSTWERSILGLPTLVIVTAKNQLGTCQDMNKLGAIRLLGEARQVSPGNVMKELVYLLNNREELKRMSRVSIELWPSRVEPYDAISGEFDN